MGANGAGKGRDEREATCKIENISQFIIKQMVCVFMCVVSFIIVLIFRVAVIFISHLVVDCVAHLNLCLIIITNDERERDK